MSSERKGARASWLDLSAEEAIIRYMSEPDEIWLEGPDGPVVCRRCVPTEEDLAWDEQDAELDVAKAIWKPDSYDN